MEVLEIQSRVIEWKPFMKEEFTIPYKAAEIDHTYLLTPYTTKFGTLFNMSGTFHVTCVNTNFILDAKFESIAKLDSNGITPIAKDLYEAYKQIHLKWVNLILQESMKEGFTLFLSDKTMWSFEAIKPKLEEVIYYSEEHP